MTTAAISGTGPIPRLGKPKTIKFRCGSCGKSNRVPRRFAGRKGRCGECRETVRVPGERRSKPKVEVYRRPERATATSTCRECGKGPLQAGIERCGPCGKAYVAPETIKFRLAGSFLLALVGWLILAFVGALVLKAGGMSPNGPAKLVAMALALPTIALLYGSDHLRQPGPKWAAAIPAIPLPLAIILFKMM